MDSPAHGRDGLGTSPASQAFTGTVQQWERLVRPGIGAYVIPEALAPLHVDRAADNGVLTEPGVWV